MLVAEDGPFLAEDDDEDIGTWVKRINKESRSRTPEPVDAGCGLTILDYISILHGDNKRWIALTKKTPRWKQWHYLYEDICEELTYFNFIDLNLDSYVSMNTFCYPDRHEWNAFELNAFYVDLDIYDVGLSLSQAVYELKEDVFGWHNFPAPTFWVYSGRGLQLIWKIETVPGQTQKALALYKKVQEYLTDGLFRGYGADEACKDASRVLRLPGSINTKSGEKAQIIEYNPEAVYTMRQFVDEYLPQKYYDEWFHSQYPEFPSKKKKVATTNPVKRKKTKAFAEPSSIARLKTKNTYTSYRAKIQDILDLCKMRNWKMPKRREFTLFLLRYWTSIVESPEIALEFILQVNSKFAEPLSEHEVIEATKSADDAAKAFLSEELVEWEGRMVQKGYNYKNESLIKIFTITPEEQEHLSFIISKDIKYSRNNARRRAERRNENGLTRRKQQEQDTIQQVAFLLSEGVKQKEIAEKLEITPARVSQIKKKLNEKALYICEEGVPETISGGSGVSTLSNNFDPVSVSACFESATSVVVSDATIVTTSDVGSTALSEVAVSNSS